MTETENKPLQKITGDLDELMAVFPLHIQSTLQKENSLDDLVEVVMDFGRRPKAYFATRELILSAEEVTQHDIDHVVANIGKFMGDNRAGIERTLHRISGMRNRQGKIIGLTCRVGRAIYGTIDIIEDLLKSGKSILLLGRPGVGKTTMLREAARIVAEDKRVIVVDTSNEIAGDGDIPHPAIGKARRMQVPQPTLQHQVMIEAVENHTPQVIIIDEIGRLEEAEAARTIAERGVQLIGTAHGNSLDNLLVNPTLADLVGGIDSVTLSDEEARRRNTQKSVLERRSPPTFDILIELKGRDHLVIHHDVARAVDSLLRGRLIQPEIRFKDESGKIKIERTPRNDLKLTQNGKGKTNSPAPKPEKRNKSIPENVLNVEIRAVNNPEISKLPPQHVFLFGTNQQRFLQAAGSLRVPVVLVKKINEADIFITLKSHYRKHSQPITEAEQKNIPMYILRANTSHQMEKCLADIFNLSLSETDTLSVAMRETQDAIRQVLQGTKSMALTPQEAFIRKKQHEMARQSNLISHSTGKDPNRRVKIFRTQ